MTPEEIQRALGSLRHEEPVPDDVAARLDAALAGLDVEDAPATPAATARARSPRNRRWLWVAATVCAVAVAGGPLVQRLDLVGGGAESTSAADAGADTESAPGSDPGSDPTQRRMIEAGPPVALTSTDFAAQARAVAAGEDLTPSQDGGGVGTLVAPEDDPSDGATPSPRASAEVCRPPATGGGEARLVPATYDGAPATLVLRGDVATLWACDGTRVLNEAQVTR